MNSRKTRNLILAIKTGPTVPGDSNAHLRMVGGLLECRGQASQCTVSE